MPKSKSRIQDKPSKLRGDKRGRLVTAVVLALSLIAAGAALAQRGFFSPAPQEQNKQGAQVSPTALTPSTPSKEYVYAGSRLVATEEPTSQTGANGAAFVSQSVPASMTAGQSYSVTVTMSNTGTSTWSAGAYSLGSQNPQGNSTWGLSQVGLSSSIAPGSNATFPFNVPAPPVAGAYN